MFALDTNAFIHAMKGQGRIKQRIKAVGPGALCIPAIVAYELEFGTLRSSNPSARRRELNSICSVLQILPFDRRAADFAASLRFDLEVKGQVIGPLDTLIAATVMAHGATLVTHNVREFSRIAGLRIEDWY